MHLAAKGIFANLVETQEGAFEFLPPTMWSGLLGLLKSWFIEGSLDECFRHLGNAISVPQAALALLVALRVCPISEVATEIKKTIHMLWHSRLTALNSVCVAVDDGFFIYSIGDFLMSIRAPSPDLPSESHLVIMWPDNVTTHVNFKAGEIVDDILQRLSFPAHVRHLWGLWFPETKTFKWNSSELPVGTFAVQFAFAPECGITNAEDDHCRDDEHCSDTAPFTTSNDDMVPTTVPDDEDQPTVLLNLAFHDRAMMQVLCSPEMTFQEVVINSGYEELIGVSQIYVEDVAVPWNTLIDDYHSKTARIVPPTKKPKCSPGGHVIEVVLLDGQTRFIPAAESWTLRFALINAGYPEEMIHRLTPLHNGRRFSLDSTLADLDLPHIRLACYPLQGGKGKSKGSGKMEVDPLQLRDPWSTPAPSNSACRWDQLLLPEKHHFFCKTKGVRLTQIPVSQASNQHGVLCSLQRMPSKTWPKFNRHLLRLRCFLDSEVFPTWLSPATCS